MNCPHWRSVFSSVFKEPKLTGTHPEASVPYPVPHLSVPGARKTLTAPRPSSNAIREISAAFPHAGCLSVPRAGRIPLCEAGRAAVDRGRRRAGASRVQRRGGGSGRLPVRPRHHEHDRERGRVGLERVRLRGPGRPRRLHWAKYPMAQADIDSYNRDAEELVAYLLSHGVVASLTADRHGIATASCDETEAA